MLPAPVTAVVTPLTEATGLASWAWLLIAVPAASAAFLLLAGRRSNAWGHWLGPAPPFAGPPALDVLHRLDHVPDPGLKVTSTDFTMAAGGPATNAAVTYAALEAAARSLSADEAVAFGEPAVCWGKFDEKSFLKTAYHKRLLREDFYRQVTIRSGSTVEKIASLLARD